ncbi:hypothetical protein [Mediterraneibacter agrestimuris]
MDKYEYKLKTEQMLELMNDGAYNRAAEIADTIDWKRVRNSTMLGTVSEIYEKNRDYQKSYEVLRVAYNRAEGSRKIISRLCTLALRTGNVDEAIDYYDDFMELAPKDPNQFILKYRILRAQRAPIEQQIHALEAFKKAEYIEEWAYELAKLYQEAGMTRECLEECDDLILWFSEGQYVYQTMELKMQYKPLTPSQQEKYDRRYEKMSVSNETEEIPDLTQYQKTEAAGEKPDVQISDEPQGMKEDNTDSEVSKENDLAAQQSGKKKIGNTMKLDEALKSLLNIVIKAEDEPAGEPEPAEETDEDLTELESKIEAIESVADLGFAEKVAGIRKREATKVDPDLEELKPLPEEELEVDDEAQEQKDVKIQKAAESNGDQIQGQMSFMDILEGWGEPEAEVSEETAEDFAEEEAEVLEETAEDFVEEEAEVLEETAEDFVEEEAEVLEETAEDFVEEEAEVLEETAEEFVEEEAEVLGEAAEDFVEEETEVLEEAVEDFVEEEAEVLEEAVEDFVEGEPESVEEIAEDADNTVIIEQEGETMENKKNDTPILSPDIQRLIDEIEGNIPPQEDADQKPPMEEGETEEAEDITAEENYEEEAFKWGTEDALDEEEAAGVFSGVFDGDEESGEFNDEEYDEELADEYEEYDEELADEYDEFDEMDDDYEEDDEYDLDLEEEESAEVNLEEEFRLREYADGIDDREVPDDDEEEMDLLSATTPLSRKETAKLIATGKTAPLPLDEISDALSMSDTGFIVHGRYDLKTQSGIGTRAGLTEEQKKLFSYFVPVRGMSEQLVDVLEQDKNCTNRQGTSCTGNLLIIGNKGNGKTVLAVDVVKAIQKQRKIHRGKVAIVTGESLNKKKISDIVGKLYGGALIIEKAGKMNEKTVSRLNKAMEQDTGELFIVLEDQRKPLDRLLSSNREFRRKFTSRLEVPVFINDELVTFGQTYAQENGYRIDEMSILALYSRIDSLQREDHAVTIAEVKEIMDEAMAHSQKASAKKLVKRVFGKNTDDSDRIILTEKDFNV